MFDLIANKSTPMRKELLRLAVFLAFFAAALSSIHAAATAAIQDLRLYAGITATGTPGVAYELQYCTNLQDPGGWSKVTNVVLDAKRLFFVDLDSSLNAARFYRLPL